MQCCIQFSWLVLAAVVHRVGTLHWKFVTDAMVCYARQPWFSASSVQVSALTSWKWGWQFITAIVALILQHPATRFYAHALSCPCCCLQVLSMEHG